VVFTAEIMIKMHARVYIIYTTHNLSQLVKVRPFTLFPVQPAQQQQQANSQVFSPNLTQRPIVNPHIGPRSPGSSCLQMDGLETPDRTNHGGESSSLRASLRLKGIAVSPLHQPTGITPSEHQARSRTAAAAKVFNFGTKTLMASQTSTTSSRLVAGTRQR
jgi:hypothetical protein